MKIKKEKQMLKLYKGSISKIIAHPLKQNCVVVAGCQGLMSFIELNPFRLMSSHKICHQYSTCLMSFGRGFCMGNSVGQLIYINYEGIIIRKINLYEDCLSSISQSDSYIVTTGFDGVVLFLNKIDFLVERKLDLETPIWDSLHFENKIYVAGNPSYSIDCNTFQVEKLKRFDSFAVFNNKIYANSDERGLTCLKSNSNSYIPCSFILPLEERMMIFSQQCATEINHQHQMEWKCHRIKSIEKGVIITSGCALQNFMILGDNEGSIYKLQYEMSRNTPRGDTTSSSDQCN